MSTAVVGFYEPEGRSDSFRWSLAAVAVLAAHLGILAAYLALRPDPGDQAQAPVIAVEFEPMPVEPAPAVAAAPEMLPSPPLEEQEPPPPSQPLSPPETQTMVMPLPDSEQPAVEVPPPPKPVPTEQPKEQPTRAPAEQRHIKAVREPPKKPATATRTQPARAATAPTSGVTAIGSREAQTSWRSLVAAHLARYKRYPAEAEARHDTGTVRLSFTLDRNGHVLSRHIDGSSGSAVLDREVLSMIERAQPLPAFPPGMPQTRMTLVVPIRFSLR
jgi:periplasmic protein TonB